MSEELKALYNLIARLEPNEDNVAKAQDDIKTIETALKRLGTIEEENKSLRASIENLDETYFETWLVCEELKKNNNYALMFIDNIYCLVDTKGNKFDVIDNYEINSKGIIENKKAKALEIIKEKNVDVSLLRQVFDNEKHIPQPLFYYNNHVDNYRPHNPLTQEEYDLLKGELK